MFHDFQAIKAQASFEQVLTMLGVPFKVSGEQLRAKCPVCNDPNERGLVCTPSKGLFYCFHEKKGGDVIKLVSLALKVSEKEAADKIAMHLGLDGGTQVPMTRSEPAKTAAEKKNRLQPLDYLQTDWHTRETLSVSPATLAHFGAGYAPKGMMQGRLAVPLHDNDGTLVAYVGVALRQEEPQVRYKYPKDFVPDLIFNAHRIEAGILYVITKGDILSVLQAYENGVTNCVAVIGNFTVDQTERLLTLMRSRGIEALELF